MSYCSECGAELTGADKFCTECGTEVDPDQVSAGTASQGTGGRSARQRPAERGGQIEESSGFTTGQKVVFVGAAVTAVGAFLPWLTADLVVRTVSKSGIDGDGALTLAFGLIAGIGSAFRWGKVARGSVVLLGALTAGLGLLYISDPLAGSGITNATAQAAIDPGMGLYVTAIGGLAILAGPILDYA